MNHKSYIIIVVVLFVAAGLGLFFRSSEDSEIFKPLNSETSSSQDPESLKLLNIETSTYHNGSYGFSFLHPKGFLVAELPGENGEDVILVQPSSGNNVVLSDSEESPSSDVEPPAGGSTSSHRGFQIAITPFDEEGPITSERIKQDIPDMIIEDSKEVLISENKSIRALMFLSDDPSLGKTREVWFMHEGFLYQITAYVNQDAFLGPTLDSWRFF